MLQHKTVSFSAVQQMVGKLVSLECTVLPGMWYTRYQYAAIAIAVSGLRPDARKAVKNSTLIKVNAGLKEEWFMWIEFLAQNRGAPWKTFHNIQRSLLGNFLLICFSKTFKSRKGKL